MRFRWFHRRYAQAAGFFWLPCPLCGQYFGGHEWRDINGKPSTVPFGRSDIETGICPDCTRAGRGSHLFARPTGREVGREATG